MIMNKKEIADSLKKYNIPENNLKKLMKHLSYYKEKINVRVPKFIGDQCFINIHIKYMYDENLHIFNPIVDGCGISPLWSWDDDFEYDDENDLHYVLRNAICVFLDNHYNFH